MEKMHRHDLKGRKLVVKEDFDVERDKTGRIVKGAGVMTGTGMFGFVNFNTGHLSHYEQVSLNMRCKKLCVNLSDKVRRRRRIA